MGTKHPGSQTLRALDAVNFLMADVETGIGPFLAVYLASSRHWTPAQIGIAMSASGFATVAAQTPAGAIVDRLRHKREAIAVGAVLVAIASLAIRELNAVGAIVFTQGFMGMVGAFFPPAMAGLTLGIVGKASFDRRIGRNETFNHAGNVFNAILCGLIGYYLTMDDIFIYVPILCLVTISAIFFIKGNEIDFEQARGCVTQDGKPAKFLEVVKDRTLLIFVVAVTLFHFANAAMLPLIGQRLAQGHAKESSLAMAVCIVGAQAVMVPVALMAGWLAPLWGRKAVFLIGFGILPVRGVLYTFSDNPWFLIGVQLLDGIGAGIFGVVSVLVIADLTRGSGRFNFTLGVVATATGLGASLSNGIAGFVVQHAGYHAAFLFLAAIAAVAFAVFFFAMPETLKRA